MKSFFGFKAFGMIAAIAGLGACQSTAGTGGASPPLSGISAVTLNQELPVELTKSRVYVQDGRVKSRSDVNEYRPYCYFWLYRHRDTLQDEMTVAAERFPVQSVNRRVTYASLAVPTVAQIGFSIGIGNGGTSNRTWATHFALQSLDQPQVQELICAVWSSDPHSWLNSNQIEALLGDVATLERS